MSSISSRAKLLGAVAIAFACGLLFSAGFDLTKLGFAQGKTPTRTAALIPAPASVVELNTSFVGIAERLSPAVVSISAERTQKEEQRARPNIQRRNTPPGIEDFFQQFGTPQQQQPQFSSGTGFIVSQDGYVLTNNHVVAGMDKIRVSLTDRRELSAKVVGRDPQTDVAVLKVESTNLPVTPLGDDASVKVGEWVLAIGNPLGLDHTVTAGIVSAKGRNNNDLQGLNQDSYSITDFIQTDAAINPGNSGGPLVNIKGEVIGINSAIATRTGYYQGYGFAIPISLARDVMNDLIKNGRVRRAVIGVRIGEVSPAAAKSAGLKEIAGAIVQNYSSDDSPAKRAGLEVGDVIVKADGKTVDHVATLQRIIRSHQPGENVELEVARFGERKTIRVKLIEAQEEPTTLASSNQQDPSESDTRPERRAANFSSETLGITVEAIDQAFVREAKVPEDYRKGVRIVEGEQWARRYFRTDGAEILVAVLFPRPRRDITSIEDFRAATGKARNGDSMSFLLYDVQNKSTRVASITIGEQ